MAALALLAVPSAAAAQSDDGAGFYLGVSGGLNFLSDTEIDTALGAVDNEYDGGFVLSGQAGYDSGRIWQYGSLRGELELSYRENEIDQHVLGGTSLPGSTGTASATALMANLFHDFETGTPLTPYVGGGIGYAWNELDNFGVTGLDVLDDDDSGFAWQLGAGLGFAVTEQATVSLDYRYFSTSADLKTTAAAGSVGNQVDLDSHTVMLGLRYRF
jgi:outer membrane autotransporter protein